MPADLPISEEDWNQTPAAVQALLLTLWKQVTELRAEGAKLREQIWRNSQNSSQPPSSDPPNAPARPPRTPSGRKAGGQTGHPGHGRKRLPVEQVKHVVDLKPTTCRACGALLLGEDDHPLRHQVTELPRIEAEVTEYRQHTLTCLACGAPTPPEAPPDIPSSSFGPRVQATVGYLTGRVGISQREVGEVLNTVFHTDISLGR